MIMASPCTAHAYNKGYIRAVFIMLPPPIGTGNCQLFHRDMGGGGGELTACLVMRAEEVECGCAVNEHGLFETLGRSLAPLLPRKGHQPSSLLPPNRQVEEIFDFPGVVFSSHNLVCIRAQLFLARATE